MQKNNLFFKLFLPLLLFVGSEFYGNNSSSIIIDCFSSSCSETIEKKLPEQIFIGTVSYQFDFDYDKSLIKYLVGIDNDSEIQRSDLISALFYLRQLDRFKKLKIEIEEVDQLYNLKFYLYGHKIFSKLILSGSIWIKLPAETLIY